MASGAGPGRGRPTPAVKVVWTKPAVRDIARHAAYLKQFNPKAARELAVALFTAGDSLATFPNRGRYGGIPGTRELVAVYPYVIAYDVRPDRVVIQRVRHGKLLT